MNIRYRVELSEAERRELETLLSGGKHGPAIQPGNAKQSLLMQYLRGERTPRMPMGGSLPGDTLNAMGAAIDEMKTILHRNFATFDEYALKGEQAPTELRLLYRHQSSSVADRCLELAQRMFKSMGGSGLFATQPFGRIYADLIAARQHVSNQNQITGRGYGAVLLGLENQDLML